MRILLLCEGDAATADSWSGISRSILTELRRRGHAVSTGDVELYGLARWLTAGLSFSPDSRRWRTRYRLGPVGFACRSHNARRHVGTAGAGFDCVIQIGATFVVAEHGGVPYALMSDSNIRLAVEGAATGYTQAVALTQRELRDVERREAAVYRGAAAIFTLSERTRRSFIEGFGLDATRIHTVHAGPNFDRSRLAALGRTENHPPTVLFVGKQFHRKGGDVLLAAFREVKRHVPSAVLTVVGPDRLDATEPGVVSLGFLSKDRPEEWATLVDAYRSADVFCLPTRFEPLGVAFLEAMHFALPCVGTDVSAVREMVVDGETGFIVPADDVTVLADRLLRLLRDKELACKMGEAGRLRAQRCFTWEAVVDRMLQVLGPLVERARSRV